MAEMCLDPQHFAVFIGLLDGGIVEGIMNGIRIYATAGPVDWIWLPREELWCINGKLTDPGVGF